jgi:heptosyltransferase-1
MRRILLVKTSSLGDVVHNLPVASDIQHALPGATIDWVVEQSFASIPAMHPGVRRVIGCDLRAWRRAWLSRETRSAWRAFLGELRGEDYDAVVDTQGLLKSAVVTHAARGRRVGLDWHSSREPLRVFYDEVHRVPWSLHAVERNRRLAAKALGYEVRGEPDYGIAVEKASAPWLPAAPYTVFLHASSDSSKCWPERNWIELGTRLIEAQHALVLPWGSASEQERATRLAAALNGACVAPPLSIAELASVIAGARFAIGVDTGLTHLAAALHIPVIGIYGTTDPASTGVNAPGLAVNLGGIGRFPSTDEVIGALRGLTLLA